MESFNTIEKVRDLFEQKGMNRTTNCYFVAYRNTNKDSMKYGLVGGLVGGAIGGAIAGAIGAAINGTLEGIDKHDGYLLNSTEEGIAIIPMDYKGVMMTINPSKMVPVLEKAVFVSNEGIESIVAKNYNIFNSKVKTVNMVFKDETKLCLIVKAVEKDIPYHQDNFNKFFEKYKKK